MNLVTAYRSFATAGRPLESQMQGSCGVFSFYYSVRLIQAIEATYAAVPALRAIHPPKNRYKGAPDYLKPGEGGFNSIRDFAKKNANSAQGEILTAEEMLRIIRFYKYDAKPYNIDKGGDKAAFISKHLRQNHPVMIAYWIDDFGKPVETDKEPGSHWSVIVDDPGSIYKVINPHDPSDLRDFDKTALLKSNHAVDGDSYPREYYKTGAPPKPKPVMQALGAPPVPPRPKPLVRTYETGITTTPTPDVTKYDLYPDPKPGETRRKQNLKDVIVAVF